MANKQEFADHLLTTDEMRQEVKSVWRCAIGDVTTALDIFHNGLAASRKKADREQAERLKSIIDLIWAARDQAPASYGEAFKVGQALTVRVRQHLSSLTVERIGGVRG